MSVAETTLTLPRTQPAKAGSFDYDIAVIGGGPGGYVAAIRGAQLGASVALIENKELGGTCLNVGCIPTKAVISSVALYRNMLNAKAFGLVAEKVGYELPEITGGAKKVVKQLVSGIGLLLKRNNIRHIKGSGSLLDARTVLVKGETEQKITARNVIIATGSAPVHPPIKGLDAFPTVWTSDDAVFADRVPEKLVVVGAGAIGLEFGYIFNGLGSKVTIVEMMPQILPSLDAEAANELGRHLKRQGIEIKTGATITSVSAGKDKKGSGKVTVKGSGDAEELEADVLLLAAGRRPVTENLNLEALGIKTDRRAIVVNEYYETSVPGVYAIGDVIGEPLLAHAASAEGEAAAANIMGGREKVNYHAMPGAIYTHPEMASAGYTESSAREKYSDVVVGRFSFAANGRALGEREPEGFVKLVVSAKYGEILGVHIVGAHASDLLAECATAIASELTVDELINSVHGHPTLAEVVHEAACDARGRCLNKA